MANSLATLERDYEILETPEDPSLGGRIRLRHLLLGEERQARVLPRELTRDPERLQRLREEIRGTIRRRHPHLARVDDLRFADDGEGVVVFESLPGITLEELLARPETVSPALATEIVRQLLLALAYLHHEGCVHGDLSPDNVMLGREASGGVVAKLIDLGIARAAGDAAISRDGILLEKLRYASPEHLEESDGYRRIDRRSDLYSVGILLYELLTGRSPLRGGDPEELIAAHIIDPIVPFEESDPSGRLPEPLRRLVENALAKSTASRVQSAEHFLSRLAVAQSALDSSGVAAELEELIPEPIAARPLARQPPPPRSGVTDVRPSIEALLERARSEVANLEITSAQSKVSTALNIFPQHTGAQRMMTGLDSLRAERMRSERAGRRPENGGTKDSGESVEDDDLPRPSIAAPVPESAAGNDASQTLDTAPPELVESPPPPPPLSTDSSTESAELATGESEAELPGERAQAEAAPTRTGQEVVSDGVSFPLRSDKQAAPQRAEPPTDDAHRDFEHGLQAVVALLTRGRLPEARRLLADCKASFGERAELAALEEGIQHLSARLTELFELREKAVSRAEEGEFAAARELLERARILMPELDEQSSRLEETRSRIEQMERATVAPKPPAETDDLEDAAATIRQFLQFGEIGSARRVFAAARRLHGDDEMAPLAEELAAGERRERIRLAGLCLATGDQAVEVQDFETARRSYERAAQLDPTNGLARRRLWELTRREESYESTVLAGNVQQEIDRIRQLEAKGRLRTALDEVDRTMIQSPESSAELETLRDEIETRLGERDRRLRRWLLLALLLAAVLVALRYLLL